MMNQSVNEYLDKNLLNIINLLKTRLMSQYFKVKIRTFNTDAPKKACICYIEGLAHKEILAELEQRLDEMFLDRVCIFDIRSFRLNLSMEDFSPVETIGMTDSLNVVVQKLLQGKIAVLFDEIPGALTIPFHITENLQYDRDYTHGKFISSTLMLVRLFCFLIATSFGEVKLRSQEPCRV